MTRHSSGLTACTNMHLQGPGLGHHASQPRQRTAYRMPKIRVAGAVCTVHLLAHGLLLCLLLDAEHLDQSKGSSRSETTNDHRAGCSVQVSTPTTLSSPARQRCTSEALLGYTHVKYVLKAPKMKSTTPVRMHEMIRPSSADDVAMYGMSGMRPPIKYERPIVSAEMYSRDFGTSSACQLALC